jgi:TolB protein
MNTENNYAKAATVAAPVMFSILWLFALGVGAEGQEGSATHFTLRSTIAFVSTRDDPTGNPLLTAEIYLMDEDGTHARRVTENADGDGFPALSPDGKKMVFDSNRLRANGEPLNTSDLFVMDVDGTEEAHLIRGSSGTWSPDSKSIAFHASASGLGHPIKADPGAATSDSDIFVLNVDDLLTGVAQPKNITNNPDAIDDDPDWSPDGQQIVFTSHDVNDSAANSVTAEIYVLNADGTGVPTRLTNNGEEERAPAWSPDGTGIVFMCRRGLPPPGAVLRTFEICVMNADGSGQVQLTNNTVNELTPSWSPDGQQIVFHRLVSGRFQLWLINADGTGLVQLTNTLGANAFGNWGELRVHVPQATLLPFIPISLRVGAASNSRRHPILRTLPLSKRIDLSPNG